MNKTRFETNILEAFLEEHIVATMPEMMTALGTPVSKTVLRKLKELSYRTSYSHSGKYYCLDRLVRFDERGLWSYRAVWFSRHGTLLTTLREFVSGSEEGWFAHELKECLHVGVKEALLKLTKNGQISREAIYGIYLYCSADPVIAKRQVLARKSREETESDIERPSDEVKAALLIFWSVLDEKSRRLFAGFESLRVGYGGDKQVAQWLGLDPHTVAKGRRELLEWDVELERVRRAGGGRRGKKARRSSPRSRS